MQPFARRYQRRVSESADVDEREYSDPEDEVLASLIHCYYVSKKDIEVCVAHNIDKHCRHPNFAEIDVLHKIVKEKYASE